MTTRETRHLDNFLFLFPDRTMVRGAPVRGTFLQSDGAAVNEVLKIGVHVQLESVIQEEAKPRCVLGIKYTTSCSIKEYAYCPRAELPFYSR